MSSSRISWINRKMALASATLFLGLSFVVSGLHLSCASTAHVSSSESADNSRSMIGATFVASNHSSGQ